MITIDGIPPKNILSPTSIDELSLTLAQAEKEGKAITPMGSGTKLGWGNIPAKVDYVVETKHFRRILNYEPADLTVSVEAGCSLSILQETLRKHGQFLPLDPPYADQSTVGGVVACNASGPLRFRYGAPRDMVIGMKVAHANGEVSKAGGRVVKNVSGYDLCKLYTGSFGTLGIITEVNFKLHPLPETETDVTCMIAFPTIDEAIEGAKTVLNSQLTPSALELADSTIADAPHGIALLVRFSDLVDAVDWEVKEIEERLFPANQYKVVVTKGEAQQMLWQRVVNFDRFCLGTRRDTRAAPGHVICLKSTVPLNSTAEIYTAAWAAARELDYRSYAIGHAGNGLLFTYWAGEEFNDRLRDRFVDAIQHIRSLTATFGGSTVVLTAPASLKEKIDVWGYNRSEVALMKALKKKFDPKGILNPGRFVDRI